MLFNSLEFALFLPLVFILYWFVFQRKIIAQNIFILTASYIFYGWWDARFLLLIAFSTLVDYWCGLKIDSSTNRKLRKWWLALSMLVNLGLLGFFKYYNFFVESWVEGWGRLGYEMDLWTIQVILPVGISFYTFQTMSYSLDIYKGRLKPTSDFISFAAFVSFFPQLVAGPIERASNLLPQFTKKRQFNLESAKNGLRQILWGLFKKIVIADNCAILVNDTFANYESLPASALVLGIIYFAFQIYCDFSGYSDIAIGTARLFGINLMRNFAYPYFSRDIGEFWRRWHISLSSWFKDYLYIPLGGSRGTNWNKFKNVMIIFVVSGFWHGANWTFIVWGVLNALYFLPLMLSGQNRVNMGVTSEGRLLPSIREFWQISATFTLTCLAWIFFRADNIGQAFDYLINIFNSSLVTRPRGLGFLIFIFILLIVEWIQRHKLHPLEINSLPVATRWAIYYSLIVLIAFKGEFGYNEFIYFQF